MGAVSPSNKMKWVLITLGVLGVAGVCLGKPGNVEVLPSSGSLSGSLPPVQSGVPIGASVQPMPTYVGGLTKPSWPGGYQPQPGMPVYNSNSGSSYPSYPSSSSTGHGHSSHSAPVYGGSGFNPGWGTGGVCTILGTNLDLCTDPLHTNQHQSTNHV